MNLFKRKNNKYDLIEFSMMDISTGQIGEYILKELYENNYFSQIGYTYKNEGCGLRCTLYTVNPPNKKLVKYFEDRCPAIVENEVKNCNGMAHEFESVNEITLVVKV